MSKSKSKVTVKGDKVTSIPKKRNKTTPEPISPIDPIQPTEMEESLVTEHPIEFSDYLKEVKEIVGGNDILFKVISQDWTGPAKKYKDTAFGNLERGIISQCWRMKLPARTCAGHLWLMMKNGI